MDRSTREAFLQSAAPSAGESWADLGCGQGAFTLPLAALLGTGGALLAVDRDRSAIDSLGVALADAPRTTPRDVQLRVATVEAPGFLPPLDGVVFANVLHYVADPAPVLRAVARALKPGGRILLVEYDRTDANAWVPHPIPSAALPELGARAGIPPLVVKVRAQSDFGRQLYAAVSTFSNDVAPSSS